MNGLVQKHTVKRRTPKGTITQTELSINCKDKIPGEHRKVGVRCPECIILGVNSRVNIRCGMKTSMGVHDYYDEYGAHHIHDQNETRADWTCSQGHAGAYHKMSSCILTACEKHRGYKLLQSNPYEFAAAREERRQLAEAARKVKDASAEPTLPNRQYDPSFTIDVKGQVVGSYDIKDSSIGIGHTVYTPYTVQPLIITTVNGDTIPNVEPSEPEKTFAEPEIWNSPETWTIPEVSTPTDIKVQQDVSVQPEVVTSTNIKVAERSKMHITVVYEGRTFTGEIKLQRFNDF